MKSTTLVYDPNPHGGLRICDTCFLLLRVALEDRGRWRLGHQVDWLCSTRWARSDACSARASTWLRSPPGPGFSSLVYLALLRFLHGCAMMHVEDDDIKHVGDKMVGKNYQVMIFGWLEKIEDFVSLWRLSQEFNSLWGLYHMECQSPLTGWWRWWWTINVEPNVRFFGPSIDGEQWVSVGFLIVEL